MYWRKCPNASRFWRRSNTPQAIIVSIFSCAPTARSVSRNIAEIRRTGKVGFRSTVSRIRSSPLRKTPLRRQNRGWSGWSRIGLSGTCEETVDEAHALLRPDRLLARSAGDAARVGRGVRGETDLAQEQAAAQR